MPEAGADHSTGLLRLFVALQVPPEIRHSLEVVQTSISHRLKRSTVSWTKPQQMHLTVRFMGNVRREVVSQATAELRQAVAGTGPLTLRAESIGFFPSPSSARVVWAGLSGDIARLHHLQKAVESAVAPLCEKAAEAVFVPHLTLARIKSLDRSDASALIEARESVGVRTFGEWRVTEAHLYSSVLGRGGATHTAIASFGL